MQRLFGFLVLMLFAAGPALNVRCLVSCAPEPASESADHCHGTADAPAQLSGVAECGEGPADAVALVAQRGDTKMSAAFAAIGSLDFGQQPPPDASGSESVYALTAGPPASLLIPLRI